MKIKQILLKNFATVDEVQIDLSDGITYLVGVNGSGKTMCGLNAIWFILEGIAKTGKKVLHADRFRFIGKYGKSAIGQITLYGEKEDIEIFLQRKITKGATSLKVKASDGRDLGDGFVDKIFNIFSINPEGFAQLTPKEQATVLGIDTGDIDHKKKMVYDERRELGYLVKQTDGALDGYKGVKKVKFVDVQELIKKKAGLEDKNQEENDKARILREDLYHKAVAHNKVQTDLQSERDAICNKLTVYEEKIVLLDNELKEVRRRYVNSEKELAALPSADTLLSTDIQIPKHKQYGLSDIQGAIDKAQEQNKKAELWDKAEEQNKKAELWDKAEDARKQHSVAVNARDKKDQEYRVLEQERVRYLKSCNLPFSNITITVNLW